MTANSFYVVVTTSWNVSGVKDDKNKDGCSIKSPFLCY